MLPLSVLIAEILGVRSENQSPIGLFPTAVRIPQNASLIAFEGYRDRPLGKNSLPPPPFPHISARPCGESFPVGSSSAGFRGPPYSSLWSLSRFYISLSFLVTLVRSLYSFCLRFFERSYTPSCTFEIPHSSGFLLLFLSLSVPMSPRRAIPLS